MKLLFKLLRQNISFTQLSGFVLVNLLGGIIVLCGIQAYRDFSALSEKEDKLLSSSYIVITKPVSTLSTAASALGGRQAFSRAEIDELEALASVASVGEFRTSYFEVTAEFNLDRRNRFQTDLFLDAVPDEYIRREFPDNENGDIVWRASLDSDTVPMMLPRNYLNLYNYGFAASKGLPVLSDELLANFPITLRIRTAHGTKEYKAKVVGLTTKINTVLVPWDFINSANASYAPGKKMPPARLVVATDAREIDDSVLEYINEKGYIIEGDSSHVRLQNFIYSLLFVVIAVGFVFSLLAFFMLVISILLLIEKNKEKIVNLYSMGYSVQRISVTYQLMSLAVDAFVWIVAVVATVFIYPAFPELMVSASPGFVPVSMWLLWAVAVILAVMFAAMHGAVVFRQVNRICNHK